MIRARNILRVIVRVLLMAVLACAVSACGGDDILVISENPAPEEELDPGTGHDPGTDPGAGVDDPGQEPPQIPEDPTSGYRVYIINNSGWDPIYLYLHGDVNDLVGSWPGLGPAGELTLGEYLYIFFDLPENVKGKQEYLEFNDIDNKHTRENRPYVTFGDDKRSFWYVLGESGYTEITDPLDPGVDPNNPGEPTDPDDPKEPDDPDDPTDPDDPDDPDLVDWAAAVDYVFDPSVMAEIHLTVTRAEWNKLIEYYKQNSNTQEYVKCDARYVKNGEETSVSSAGIRLKGNTSRRIPEENGKKHHVHFVLDFHHNVKDPQHTLKGIRKVDLKFFREDPSYVREIFCYDLFRREGVYTARENVYCRLWLQVGSEKEMYYGVYEIMEHIDKNFVRTRKSQFEKKGGNLWKCRFGADLRSTNANFGIDDNVHDYTYELKTNKEEGFAAAKAQMQDFIRNLNNLQGEAFYNWISTVMDVDLFIKTYAINVVVGMWDDYWNNSNNYYLYFNTTDKSSYKVWFIPYDYDNTLGTGLQCGVQSDPGRQDPLKWGYNDNPLVTKILSKPEWRTAYINHMRRLCSSTGNFYYTTAIARIQAWQQWISPYVSNDVGEDMSIEDRPASWGNHHEYRLLTPGSNNFFQVKAASIP